MLYMNLRLTLLAYLKQHYRVTLKDIYGSSKYQNVGSLKEPDSRKLKVLTQI